MTKFIFALIFYVAFAHWMYAEVNLLAPGLVPYIDDFIARVEIPTHEYFASDRSGEQHFYSRNTSKLPKAAGWQRRAASPLLEDELYEEQEAEAVEYSAEEFESRHDRRQHYSLF